MIILHVGRMDLHHERQPGGIGREMTLAPFQPLGGVKPAWAAAFRGLDALAVDHAGGRCRFAAGSATNALDERKIDPAPDALIAPEIKVVLNSRARQKIFW